MYVYYMYVFYLYFIIIIQNFIFPTSEISPTTLN